jgi:transposase
MALYKASKKVQIGYITAFYYYNLYKNDPEKNIPLPQHLSKDRARTYTQEEITKLIKYIIDDGMSVLAASARLNLGYSTALTYCHKYLEDPNHNIPMIANPKCKQEQIAELIHHIVDNTMSIRAASSKANMSIYAGFKYYHQYISDQKDDAPIHRASGRACTQEQIYYVFKTIFIDEIPSLVYCFLFWSLF